MSSFVTTKSRPSSPGEMVTKESEPSSFRRDATSLCQAPKSKLAFPAACETAIWPRDALRYIAASFAASLVSAGTVRRLRSARTSAFTLLALEVTVAAAIGRPSNSTSSKRRCSGPRMYTPLSALVRITAPTCCSGSHIMSE